MFNQISQFCQNGSIDSLFLWLIFWLIWLIDLIYSLFLWLFDWLIWLIDLICLRTIAPKLSGCMLQTSANQKEITVCITKPPVYFVFRTIRHVTNQMSHVTHVTRSATNLQTHRVWTNQITSTTQLQTPFSLVQPWILISPSSLLVALWFRCLRWLFWSFRGILSWKIARNIRLHTSKPKNYKRKMRHDTCQRQKPQHHSKMSQLHHPLFRPMRLPSIQSSCRRQRGQVFALFSGTLGWARWGRLAPWPKMDQFLLH